MKYLDKSTIDMILTFHFGRYLYTSLIHCSTFLRGIALEERLVAIMAPLLPQDLTLRILVSLPPMINLTFPTTVADTPALCTHYVMLLVLQREDGLITPKV